MRMAVSPTAPTALRASLDHAMAANPEGVVLGDLRACDAFDVMTRIDTIRAPTLAIGGDRKSTRLNSSHVRISYAVFCLKKKNAMNFKNKNMCTSSS